MIPSEAKIPGIGIDPGNLRLVRQVASRKTDHKANNARTMALTEHDPSRHRIIGANVRKLPLKHYALSVWIIKTIGPSKFYQNTARYNFHRKDNNQRKNYCADRDDIGSCHMVNRLWTFLYSRPRSTAERYGSLYCTHYSKTNELFRIIHNTACSLKSVGNLYTALVK